MGDTLRWAAENREEPPPRLTPVTDPVTRVTEPPTVGALAPDDLETLADVLDELSQAHQVIADQAEAIETLTNRVNALEAVQTNLMERHNARLKGLTRDVIRMRHRLSKLREDLGDTEDEIEVGGSD